MEESVKRILDLCDENRVTRAKLCRAIDLPPTTMSNYVKRGDKPPYEILKKVSGYFGVSVEYLSTGIKPAFDIENEVREIVGRISALPKDKQESVLQLIYKMLGTYE